MLFSRLMVKGLVLPPVMALRPAMPVSWLAATLLRPAKIEFPLQIACSDQHYLVHSIVQLEKNSHRRLRIGSRSKQQVCQTHHTPPPSCSTHPVYPKNRHC